MKCVIMEKESDMPSIYAEYKETFLLPFTKDVEFNVPEMDDEGIFEEGMGSEERLAAYKAHMEGKIGETDSKILKKLWQKTLDFIVGESSA